MHKSKKVHVSEHSLNMYTRYNELMTEGHGTRRQIYTSFLKN